MSNIRAMLNAAPLFAVTTRTDEPALLVGVVCAAIVCALAVLTLLRGVLAVRGTTLFAPLAWSLGSLAMLFSMFAVAGPGSKIGWPQQDKWWLLAATSTFCPLIALLGAKRPQNKAWQLIVLSFWGIIALPAFQALLLQPGEAMELHGLWQCFFVVLILMGLLNYLGTPFGIAGIALAASQIILFWKWLPLVGTYASWYPAAGVFAICGSILLAGLVAMLRKRMLVKYGAAAGWNRVWLDFRDFYGLLWSRRVMQRVEEQTSGQVEWTDWYDFRSQTAVDVVEPANQASDDNNAELVANKSLSAVEPALRSLLRRFVSNEWIEKRISGEV